MFYVTNNDGACFKSDSIYVFVDSNIPQPSFYTINNCYGDSMQFYGNSGINASSLSWEWTILQEKLYSQLDYFEFDSVGIFEVNLNVINLDNNCDANINQTVEVYPTPMLTLELIMYVLVKNKIYKSFTIVLHHSFGIFG